MVFQTTEEDEGSTNVVVSPAPMLKLCQLIAVLPEVVIVSTCPELLKLAAPCATVPPTGLATAEYWSSRQPSITEQSASVLKPKLIIAFDISLPRSHNLSSKP